MKHTPADTFLFYTAPHLTLKEIEGNAPLMQIITTAPHACDHECPGEINRRKLAMFGELLKRLQDVEPLLAHFYRDCLERYGPGRGFDDDSGILRRTRDTIAKTEGREP